MLLFSGFSKSSVFRVSRKEQIKNKSPFETILINKLRQSFMNVPSLKYLLTSEYRLYIKIFNFFLLYNE